MFDATITGAERLAAQAALLPRGRVRPAGRSALGTTRRVVVALIIDTSATPIPIIFTAKVRRQHAQYQAPCGTRSVCSAGAGPLRRSTGSRRAPRAQTFPGSFQVALGGAQHPLGEPLAGSRCSTNRRTSRST
jgi:hypothetical protein